MQDTQNDAVEKVISFKYGHFLVFILDFGGVFSSQNVAWIFPLVTNLSLQLFVYPTGGSSFILNSRSSWYVSIISYDGSMWRTVYLPTWIPLFFMVFMYLGKYTVRPMDGMGKHATMFAKFLHPRIARCNITHLPQKKAVGEATSTAELPNLRLTQ